MGAKSWTSPRKGSFDAKSTARDCFLAIACVQGWLWLSRDAMAIEWIKATLALRYASFGGDEYSVRQRIIARANAGLIAAKAGNLLWDGSDKRNQRIPQAFWRTDELSGDLYEDWEQGDFYRNDRYEIQEQALDVSFDFIAISEMVPSHLQADAMRQISLTSDQDWISAHDLHQAMLAHQNQLNAVSSIIEACRLGQLAGRAERMTAEASDSPSRLDPVSKYGAMAWDVPLWFWREFIENADAQEWKLNKLSGDGRREGRWITIQLQGLHFHRSGLTNLGLEDGKNDAQPASAAKSGRRPKYDWSKATAAIWGQIFRGELKPLKQADVEKALQRYLAQGDSEPSESTVRPYASDIWNESQKA